MKGTFYPEEKVTIYDMGEAKCKASAAGRKKQVVEEATEYM